MKKYIAILALVVLLIPGCGLGAGYLGGQGISIIADHKSSIENVHITITDGGTDLGLYRPSPTTQPAEK